MSASLVAAGVPMMPALTFTQHWLGNPLTRAQSGAFNGAFSAAGRLGLDVVSMLLLVGWLYRRRVAAPEMALVFTSLNIGLLAAVTTIGFGSFPTGIGFGLFGLLSLVRLRSAAFTLKDVAYTFVALVLALVNGLPERNLLLAVFLDALLLVAVWLVDDSRSPARAQVMGMVLDRALATPEAVREEVATRLGTDPVSVAIEDVDYVRETTRVVVRYTAADSVSTQPWTGTAAADRNDWIEER